MSNDNPKWERYGQIRLSPEPDDFQVEIYKDSEESEQWFLTCKDLDIEKKRLTEADEDKAKLEALNIVSDKLDILVKNLAVVRQDLDRLLGIGRKKMILHLDRDRDTLVEWLRTWRAGDFVITTTNGVFDVIHAGHIQTLKQAMIGADKLIVGLNSDASVKRQGKGSERPLQDEMSRAIVLDAIRWVDVVVIFEEDAPYKLLEIIQPDIHVKGGDYDIETMPETSIVKFHGGIVKTVTLLEGYSTTGIIEKIMEAYVTKEVNDDDH